MKKNVYVCYIYLFHILYGSSFTKLLKNLTLFKILIGYTQHQFYSNVDAVLQEVVVIRFLKIRLNGS